MRGKIFFVTTLVLAVFVLGETRPSPQGISRSTISLEPDLRPGL